MFFNNSGSFQGHLFLTIGLWPPMNEQAHRNSVVLSLWSWLHHHSFPSSVLCLVTSHVFATPWAVAPRLLYPWGFSRQEYWSGLPYLPPGDLPNPETEPRSHALKADSLPSEPPGKSFLSSLVHQFQNICHICPLLLLFSHSVVTVWLCNPMDLQHGRLPQSFTASRGLLTLLCIESVMLSNHLVLCHPLLSLPSIFPSIRVFWSELALCIRWPKFWSFSFGISPSNEY